MQVSAFSQGVERFDSLLIHKHQKEIIPGYSILVGNFDSIIYQKQYGFSEIQNQMRITPETTFRIGSITKQFTAVGILKLVEDGQLELTTSVNDFVDFIPKKITIQHLLWHTSGLTSYFNDEEIHDSCYTSSYTASDLVELLRDTKINSKPDKEYHYSNSGYHILGYIIEQVSGMNYSEFLQKRIFEPAQMHNTQCENSKSKFKNLAKGYELTDSILTIPNYYTMDWPFSAGNIVSCPSDLLKWNNALFQGQIISDSLLNLATNAHLLKNGESSHYGFGWEIRKVQDQTTFRHSGFLEGYLSTIIFFPESKITVVVLTNCSEYSTELFATKLGALAIGKPIYNPIKFHLDSTILKEFVNDYNFDKSVISFSIIEGELCFYFDHDKSTNHPMYPISENVFYSEEFGCVVTFNKENNEMSLKIGERVTHGKKLNTTY
jgi:CubicO group peptidase (beta-lactamase class C family)